MRLYAVSLRFYCFVMAIVVGSALLGNTAIAKCIIVLNVAQS